MLDCEETTVLCFLPSWSTLLFERGLGGRGKIWHCSPQWNTKDQLPKPQTATVATAQPGRSKAAHTRTTGVKEQQVVYWANIEEGIKFILKTIGNRKGDCAWSCSRWQTQPEKISKSQSTNQYNVRSEWHWFVCFDLQIFSGCVCHFEQPHAQSPFLFPIVFSINFILRKPFLTLATNKKLNQTERGALFRHFCVSKVISAAHAHKRDVIFYIFQELSNQKKIKALRPKMTEIASRGGPALLALPSLPD